MKIYRFYLTLLLSLMTVLACAQSFGRGVSKELAEARKLLVSNVAYDLTFNIPARPEQPVTGRAVITFNLAERADVVLDFQGQLSGGSVTVGNKPRPVVFRDEHIVIPQKFLKAGPVALTLDFVSRDDALNRNGDYMYTLFVPDHARSAFPCFDQPDLRARFTTTLHVPDGWKTITSNGRLPIPTYLYSFVAGRFEERATKRGGLPMRALFRETDREKVLQLDRVFDEAAEAVRWMEGYTGIRCPFEEYGMVILPGYQFGGMEHPGAIQLSDRRIFLGSSPTKEEELSRTELIAHETAHLWFGDMVSLKWFEDVWTKEVFANFMAAKITRRQYGKTDHDLNFIKTYQAQAIAIDRTEGTHPIAMPLANLNHASLLYDNIIYDKAPVMMRILEEVMGAERMQSGLSAYLQEHYFDNASWDDLVSTLDRFAPTAGVRQFSDVWVRQKGMPNIHTSYRDGQLVITQTDPYGRGLCWPQKFQVRLIYDLGSSRTITVDMQKPSVAMRLRSKPSCIIPNYDGKGYGRFTLDRQLTDLLPKRLMTTRGDLNRYALLLLLHDNYLMGRVNPSYFGELYHMMAGERNPLVMATAIDHMFKIAFDMDPGQRATLELCMMDLLKENPSGECRKLIVRKLASNMTSPEVVRQIEAIWQAHSDPLFSERDYMAMAYRLAQLQPGRWQYFITTQRSRLTSDDLRKEFDYVARACHPDLRMCDELFNALLLPQNRLQEPWALQALELLNADISERDNTAYITSSLQSLEYIRQTSDIFFPANWMKRLLMHRRSPQSRQAVEQFLSTAGQKLSDNLRNKVLEASWLLSSQQPYAP